MTDFYWNGTTDVDDNNVAGRGGGGVSVYQLRA